MAKTYNVGIIGYGMSAHVFHIPFVALTPGLKLHAIAQRSPKPGNSAPAEHPDAKHYTSPDALIADADVDVVIVATPPDTHVPLATAALNAGKHVLVEKPFVPTSAEADKLVALAREKRLVLCVYQNRRWDLDFLTVQDLLAKDTLGRVIEFETHFDRYKPEKPTTWKGTLGMNRAGGVLYDLGTHLLDQAFVLFGLPTSVYAKMVDQRSGRIVTGENDDQEPDSVTVLLSYAKTGTLVNVRIGILSVEQRQARFWVRGTKASYHKTGLDSQENHLKAGGKASDAGFGEESADEVGSLAVLREDGTFAETPYPSVKPATYKKFYELFAKSLETGREEDIPVPGAEAAQVLRIIEAARESAKTGREVQL